MRDLVKEKAIKLMLMDEFICNECDEETWETWITYGVPDGNGEMVEDFMWLAEDPKTYADIKRLFMQITTVTEQCEYINNYLPKMEKLLDN